MDSRNKKIYSIILEVFNQSELLNELSINKEFRNKIQLLISILYAIEEKQGKTNNVELIAKLYNKKLNDSLDILEVNENEVSEDNIDSLCNWIKVCALNTRKFHLSKIEITNQHEFDTEYDRCLKNVFTVNLEDNNQNNFNNQSFQNNNPNFQYQNNNNNGGQGFYNNPQQNIMAEVSSLTIDQQKILNEKMKQFNPFDKTPKYIPIMKKIIGVMCALLGLFIILKDVAYLLDFDFIKYIAAQNKQTPPTSISAGMWATTLFTDSPYLLILGFFSFWLLKTPSGPKEKYEVNGLVYGIFIAFLAFQTYIFGNALQIISTYFKSGNSISVPAHAFVFATYLVALIIIMSLLVVTFFLFMQRPKIDREKLAQFIYDECQKIKKESSTQNPNNKNYHNQPL